MKLRLQARLITWWRAMRHRQDFERAMDEELRFHIESHAADLMAKGVSPDEAERSARLAMGASQAVTQERCRESYGLRLWDDLLADIRYALRQFRHAPGFTATVVIVLALGIGANAAMFTVIGATLLRRLPFGHANAVVELMGADRSGKQLGWTLEADILQWRKAKSLSELLYYRDGFGWMGRGTVLQNVNRPVVGVNFCGFLQVVPQVGRCFTAADADGSHGQVVMLSDDLWRGLFHADLGVVGNVVKIDQQPYTVIGVMPRGFQFPLDPRASQAWSPVNVTAARPKTDSDPAAFETLARLPSGVT